MITMIRFQGDQDQPSFLRHKHDVWVSIADVNDFGLKA